MPWRFNPFTGNLDQTDVPEFSGEVALGSAAVPSIFFTGDANTGIYSPGADQVAISTNGTGRLFINSSGYIGAGISSPVGPFHLVGDTSANTEYSVLSVSDTSDTTKALRLAYDDVDDCGVIAASDRGTGWKNVVISPNGGYVGIGTVPGGTLDIKAAASTAPLIVQGPSSEFARIDSLGRLLVGISSQSGGALLQINGDRIRVGTAKTPASATDTGTAGEICWDANYVYVCTATNTWKRSALSTW